MPETRYRTGIAVGWTEADLCPNCAGRSSGDLLFVSEMGKAVEKKIIFTEDAIQFVAQHLYTMNDRNACKPGFCLYHQLPDDLREIWINSARQFLFVLLEKLKIDEMGEGFPLSPAELRDKQQRDAQEKIEQERHQGWLQACNSRTPSQ